MAATPSFLDPRGKSEAEFRRLLDSLPAAAYTCDSTGLITFFNSKAAAFWGREPKINDVTDRWCGSFKLFSADGVPIPHDECWMALAIKQKKEFNGHEIIVERPDGSRLTALAHANPFLDESGDLSGAVNVLVDISDRKVIEKSLKDADRRKDEFLAILAHELRNPLAPMRNALELMQPGTSDAATMEEARTLMERQLEHMVRLVDDLMDVSRITRNKLALRKAPVELAAVVQSAVESVRPLIEASRHTLEVKLPEEPVYLDADQTRLSQALQNLLNNAAKYTEPNGQISLKATVEGAEAVIRVSDTGIGIPAEMLPRIFEMFTQDDRTLERSQGGLGIGLNLVRGLVEMHGGTVEAHSGGRGMGSEFVVRLPVLEDYVPAALRSSVDSEPAAKEASWRILVVDDNRDAANSLGILLRLAGNEIKVAYDGLQALDAAMEFRPDIIFLDIGLPGMSGHDVARSIREQPWGEAMFLIALTGWGQDEDRKRSTDAGFNLHMVKPVDPASLRSLLAGLQRIPT